MRSETSYLYANFTGCMHWTYSLKKIVTQKSTRTHTHENQIYDAKKNWIGIQLTLISRQMQMRIFWLTSNKLSHFIYKVPQLSIATLLVSIVWNFYVSLSLIIKLFHAVAECFFLTVVTWGALMKNILWIL